MCILNFSNYEKYVRKARIGIVFDESGDGFCNFNVLKNDHVEIQVIFLIRFVFTVCLDHGGKSPILTGCC